jgi:hypothetical protein
MGKIVFDDYKKHGEDFWQAIAKSIDGNLWYQGLKETVLQPDDTIQKIVIPADIKIHSPESPNYEDMKNKFDIIQKRLLLLQAGGVRQLLDCPSVKIMPREDRRILFRFEKSKLFDAAIVQSGEGTYRKIGEYILFGANGTHVWLSGELEQDPEAAMAPRPLKQKYTINGDGIEVKFHPSGYPARYTTIVKNRLFGRQIEWDENGNVISDVDLDIPMPWADAPKPAPEEETPESKDDEPNIAEPAEAAMSVAASPPPDEAVANIQMPEPVTAAPVKPELTHRMDVFIAIVVVLALLALIAGACYWMHRIFSSSE